MATKQRLFKRISLSFVSIKSKLLFSGVERGDKVSVYIDVEGRCRKGLVKQFEGVKVYVGNGLAEVSRRDVFVNDAHLR